MMYKSPKGFYLEPFTKEILQANSGIKTRYLNWWMDQEVTKYNSHGLFPKSKKDIEEFLNTVGIDNLVLAILVEEKNAANVSLFTHIGNVSLQNFNWINRSAEYAIVIGEPMAHGRGYGYEASKYLFSHGFNKLGLNRIWTGTSATNKGMNKLAQKLGMDLEGTSRQGMYLVGEFVDVYHYGILAKEWRSKNE